MDSINFVKSPLKLEERSQNANDYVGFKPLSQQPEQISSRGSFASTSIEPDDVDSEAQNKYINSIRLLTYNMFAHHLKLV